MARNESFSRTRFLTETTHILSGGTREIVRPTDLLVNPGSKPQILSFELDESTHMYIGAYGERGFTAFTEAFLATDIEPTDELLEEGIQNPVRIQQLFSYELKRGSIPDRRDLVKDVFKSRPGKQTSPALVTNTTLQAMENTRQIFDIKLPGARPGNYGVIRITYDTAIPDLEMVAMGRLDVRQGEEQETTFSVTLTKEAKGWTSAELTDIEQFPMRVYDKVSLRT